MDTVGDWRFPVGWMGGWAKKWTVDWWFSGRWTEGRAGGCTEWVVVGDGDARAKIGCGLLGFSLIYIAYKV